VYVFFSLKMPNEKCNINIHFQVKMDLNQQTNSYHLSDDFLHNVTIDIGLLEFLINLQCKIKIRHSRCGKIYIKRKLVQKGKRMTDLGE